MMLDLKHVILTANHTIKEAMNVLSKTGLRIVLIVDQDEKLKGTVTDGDIRRGLMTGLVIEERLDKIMNHNPISVLSGVGQAEIHSLMHKNGILAVPIIDQEGRVLGIESITSLQESSKNNTPVLIMAGGFGKRLGQLTKNLPKPMIKVGDKPIIENILDKLVEQGFYKFFISVHYKPEKVIDYFQDGSKKGIEINYLEEDTPLGTAGALSLVKDKISDKLVVINGDLLIDFDANLLTQYHDRHHADVTVCVHKENVYIPFGVVDIGEKKITQIFEKPTYSYTVNSGIYCFSSNILKGMNEVKQIDMPDVINEAAKRSNVLPFLIYEEWIDIGCPTNLKLAIKKKTS